MTSVRYKSQFLGPQVENGPWLAGMVARILGHWLHWRRERFPGDPACIKKSDQSDQEFISGQRRIEQSLDELLENMEKETPTVSPRYIGHMTSEITLPALLGHFTALLQNPNNASREVAKVGLQLEREAISALAQMLGFSPEEAHGHFTSGGTVANFEALWRARYRLDHSLAYAAALAQHGSAKRDLFDATHQNLAKLMTQAAQAGITSEQVSELSLVLHNPWATGERIGQLFGVRYRGPVVLVPGSKHYSWPKAVSLLGLGNDALWPVELDRFGHLALPSLTRRIDEARRAGRPILAIVSVCGSTELGAIDPIDAVQDYLDHLQKAEGWHFWHHVDGAYGAYYRCLKERGLGLLANLEVKALTALPRVDSITLDPHKLGYTPYSCGAIIVPDQERYRVTSFDAPYLVQAGNHNKWAWTLEGSRSATGAAASWMSARAIGFDAQGLGAILTRGIQAKQYFQAELQRQLPLLRVAPGGDCNILCFCLARSHEGLAQANARTLAIYEALLAGDAFGVSRTTLTRTYYAALIDDFARSWGAAIDSDQLQLIRLVFMNPFIGQQEFGRDLACAFAAEIRRLLEVHEPSAI